MDANMMDIAGDQPTEQGPEGNSESSPFYTEFYPEAALVLGQGQTFMDLFDEDEYAEKRVENLYYPFATLPEWELASFLLKSDLSMAATDEFLKLQLVCVCSLHTFIIF